MKKFKNYTALLVFFSLFASCAPVDSVEEQNTENLMTLKKSITYTPQEANFTQKNVKYFVDNKIVVDSTFNNLNQFIRRSTYVYNSGNRTRFNYNSSNALTGKTINIYDNLHRLVSVNSYNSSEVLTNSTSFSYQNENIFMTITSNGVSTPKYHYKTNANGYLYYEEDLTNNNMVRTLDYAGIKPTLLHYGIEDFTSAYDYYPQIKPSNMQNSAIETNNYALGNFFMEHVHFSCNYYLKQLNFNIGSNIIIQRDYTFNENNYETFLKTYSQDSSGIHNSSETFTFYN